MTEETATNESNDELGGQNECLVMLKSLNEMIDVQCSDGNWNYDPYMHGMANGMIFARSLFDDKPPEYLEPPKTWLKDLPEPEKATIASAT